jgi:hypothetical protein
VLVDEEPEADFGGELDVEPDVSDVELPDSELPDEPEPDDSDDELDEAPPEFALLELERLSVL